MPASPDLSPELVNNALDNLMTKSASPANTGLMGSLDKYFPPRTTFWPCDSQHGRPMEHWAASPRIRQRGASNSASELITQIHHDIARLAPCIGAVPAEYGVVLLIEQVGDLHRPRQLLGKVVASDQVNQQQVVDGMLDSLSARGRD